MMSTDQCLYSTCSSGGLYRGIPCILILTVSSLLTVVLARVQELPLARCGLVTVLPSDRVSVSSAATIWEIGLSGSHPNTFNLR